MRRAPEVDDWLGWRVPAELARCSSKGGADHPPPVAQRTDTMHLWGRGRTTTRRRAYCAPCLAELSREVRDGAVWWVPGLAE